MQSSPSCRPRAPLCMLLMASLGVARGDPNSRSVLPLIAQLQHSEDNAQPTHRQLYHRENGRSARRRGLNTATLTEANTQPIRYHLDFRSLYEEHAPEYSACFRAGDWFRWGLPASQTPPANGVATCSRGANDVTDARDGCWGICLDSDVITSDGRERMIQIVTSIVTNDLRKYLALKPVVGSLVFEEARSRFERALSLKGYQTSAACAADCTLLSNVAVDPAMCTSGVEADVVLSVTKPPGLSGIAGTGSSCAADQAGRPLWLVFAWHSSVTALSASTLEQNIQEARSLVLHEVLHGLGFSNSMFMYARTSTGARKELIELKRVEDQDGAIDEVWHFVKGRAHDLAAEYFGCAGASNGSWLGLPLMGLPQVGRASHWETRIMRDDVMAYGFQDAVSGITLAAMEDLGFYRANYTAADCISWGYKQGCDFVTSRCGIMQHDRSIDVTSEAQCGGDPFWASNPDTYLANKCGRGNNPCEGSSENGYAALSGSSGVGKCDGQCFYAAGQARSGCSATPSTQLEEGTLADVYESLQDTALNWRVWLIPLAWTLGAICLCGCVRRVFCPQNERARKIALLLGGVVMVFAAAICAGTIVVYVQYDVFSGFAARGTVLLTMIVAALFVFYVALTLYGVYRRNGCICITSFWILVFLALSLIVATLFMLYWLYTTDEVTADSINTIRGSEVAKRVQVLDTFLTRELATPLSTVSGFLCSTYTLCCRDPALDNLATSAGVENSTCIATREGIITDFERTLQDPSSPNFCSYVTGAQFLVTPPNGVCNLIDAVVDSFSLATCQANYCSSGVDGYLSFVDEMVALIQRYAVPLAIGLASLVVLLFVWACNIRYVGKTKHRVSSTAPRKTNNSNTVQVCCSPS